MKLYCKANIKIRFNAEFVSTFSHWSCGSNKISCSEICFGTAKTVLSALRDNSYLKNYFFESQYTNIQLSEAISDLYHVNLFFNLQVIDKCFLDIFY